MLRRKKRLTPLTFSKALEDVRNQSRSRLILEVGQPDWSLVNAADGTQLLMWKDVPNVGVRYTPNGKFVTAYFRQHMEPELLWRLRTLGDLTGSPKDVIVSYLGPPNAFTAGDGYELLQWIHPETQVGLQFDLQGWCIRVAHWQHVPMPAAPRRSYVLIGGTFDFGD